MYVTFLSIVTFPPPFSVHLSEWHVPQQTEVMGLMQPQIVVDLLSIDVVSK